MHSTPYRSTSRKTRLVLVALAVCLWLGGSSTADASCGDYLFHDASAPPSHLAASESRPDAEDSLLPTTRCAGGLCRQAPGQIPLGPPSGLPTLSDRCPLAWQIPSQLGQGGSASLNGSGLWPRDEAAPAVVAKSRVDRPPRNV